MRAALATASLLVLLLAGCASPPAADPLEEVGPRVVVDENSELGAIAGVVVDEAIRPIVGARVVLQNSDRVAETDDGGQFAFEDLEPGTYFLEANATGFAKTQASVQVVAGAVARAKLLLPAEAFVQGYSQVYRFRGFIQASGAATGPIVNIILDEFGDNPFCTCTLEFDTEGLDVRTIVVEAVWTDTLASPTGPSALYLEVFPLELDDGTDDIQGGFLTSPILQHYPIGMWGDNETNTQWRARLSGAAESVQYNQEYDLVVTLFVNAPAPEGWSLVAGDLPP